MSRADRRYFAVVAAAWVVVWGLIVTFIVRTGVPEYGGVPFLAVGFIWTGLLAAVVTAIVVAIPLRIVLNLAIKDRRRSHWKETIALSVFLAAVVAYPFEVQREQNRLAPPPGVHRLEDFAQSAAAPQWIELVQHDGEIYLAWFGEHSGPIDVPSGPSCYLFDHRGELIDWQSETGEGGQIDHFLRSSSRVRKITLAEALEIMKPPAGESAVVK